MVANEAELDSLSPADPSMANYVVPAIVEGGSDLWKQYMQCQPNKINYGNGVLLAQGINFGF